MFLLVEGVVAARLDWPFTLRELEEALVVEIPSPEQLTGQLAPDFSTLDLHGRKISLADLPKPLLLTFVDLVCPPCWEVLPILEELAQEVAVVLIAIVGKSGLSKTNQAQLEEFVRKAEEKGGTAIVLVDRWTPGKEPELVRAYRVRQSPTFILVDGKGVIVGIWQGKGESDKFAEEMRAGMTNPRR